MIQKSLSILRNLKHSSGLFSASPSNNTGYSKAWIRDNVYSILGFEVTNNYEEAVNTLQALLDILIKHEYKIDWMISDPEPKAAYRYIHARYEPITGNEVWEEWGNKQNDSIGALLFKIGDLEQKGVKVLRNDKDKQIIQKLVHYLGSIKYWQDPDNGIWEEYEEVHASSLGACVAGLVKISDLVEVPEELILKGKIELSKLLPKESKTKEIDLSLLSLIYPYNVVSDEMRDKILQNVENHLVRQKGIIRYKNDQYYNNGKEAEWVFGFPWLAIIYKNLGNNVKAAHYLQKSLEVMNEKGELPELYLGGTSKYNENSPLGWAQSLLVVALA